MYTQCPDCGTAFRVTATILKQAAGKVRCGGCGNAFNALEYLSEEKPNSEPRALVEEKLPELKPDEGEPGVDGLPKSISAEQSAALLKTLDELAGSDIRIEDTGVEWRVVDDDSQTGSDEVAEAPVSPDDTGSIRWFIDESTAPADETLSEEPGEIDAPEIFEDTRAGEQMRFDDDTPLPEDFDFDAEPAEKPESLVESREDPSASEAEQVDLALGEPEDWEHLLEEVHEPADAPHEQEAVAESGQDVPEVTAAEEQQPEESLAVDDLPGVDEQFATQAEAMGIDLSGMHARLQEAEDAKDGKQEPDIEETSIDEDLVAAAFETEAAARAEREVEDVEAEAASEVVDEDADDEVVAEALEVDDEEPVAAEAGDETTKVEPDVESEAEPHVEPDIEPDFEETVETAVESPDEEEPAEVAEDEKFEIDLDFDDKDLIEARDRELVSSTEEDARLAAELGLDDDDTDGENAKAEPVFLPESEEEKTVNMMIDQDLLAIAVEDEDGFASTIVQKQSDDDEDETAPEETPEPEMEQEKENPLVETIIMEGEYIRDADEEERLEKARKETGDPDLKSAAAAEVKEIEKKDEPPARKPIDYRMIAGIAALVIVLVAQGIHQMRESLVTLPGVGDTLGSLYRAVGRPVTPDWDISGWRFEATKGSTDEDDAVLTIYSRVGNKSAEPLPYPLISVALTDRYEDIIGSKILEPGEYLADNLDTRRPVAPGDTFSAVIAIDSPSANATGFKLNVCYRQAGGKLKCAIDDFK